MELLALLLLQSPAPLPPDPRVAVIASPAADTVLAQDPLCRDEELLRLAHGDAWARLWLPLGAWNAVLGDTDFDGSFDAPAGVDGLAWAPMPGAARLDLTGLWFSSDSDFLVWKDGDVLRVDEYGWIVLVHSEDDIRTALATASNFDLDAIARDRNGRLWFSLRDGLSVSALGTIEDGDILIYDSSAGTVQRHATEAEVQAWAEHASPGLGPIGDVKGLAFDPMDDSLLFLVQAPSALDASVFSSAQGGVLRAGFGEADFGFAQSTELDALAAAPADLPQPPVLHADTVRGAPGELLVLRVHHATPYAVLQGIVSHRRAVRPSPRGGFGLQVPALGPQARAWPAGGLQADASGSATSSLNLPLLPPGHTHLDLSFQLFDGLGAGLSTPWIVRVQ